MNLEDAIQVHAEWKLKLRSAISKKEHLDAATIVKDNVCVLGCWLHGDAKGRLSAKPEYQRVVEKHKAFHAEAAKVATLINAGKHSEAEAALGSSTPYASISGELGVALLALKRAASL